MSAAKVADFIGDYAKHIDAPVHPRTTVSSVRAMLNGYRVITNRGEWQCRTVVLANGACAVPCVPRLAEAVPEAVQTLTPHSYKSPHSVSADGVLVVGASATGLQLADEIQRSGRQVTLAVGEHVRMPRLYRDKDIQWWMRFAGILDERFDTIDDIRRARRVPSPQLIGTPERRNLDLNALRAIGVRIVGRLAGIHNGRAQFSGSLRNMCASADLKQARLLDRIDETANAILGDDSGFSCERPEPTLVDENPTLAAKLDGIEIGSIVWATGFKPDYSWLEVPVIDRRGKLRHIGGVVDAPGMYTMGLNFMRQRKSSFIHGAADDSRELCGHLANYLSQNSRRRRDRIAMGG